MISQVVGPDSYYVGQSIAVQQETDKSQEWAQAVAKIQDRQAKRLSQPAVKCLVTLKQNVV